ncbi:Alpha/Beta hydrolase protein [Xylaria bambusicola]|uniref:Alpha/Beta hydrolase protein n=1 Tax=Xylaria bambusicola TaxID=326684 RepID=UPI00200786AF|nr:Alpha/Beta hydrolase protein [Xylaria bambusicola]KAI0508478.1 Alpha/Beta hydrolase protein [Xylaria bambusicola]
MRSTILWNMERSLPLQHTPGALKMETMMQQRDARQPGLRLYQRMLCLAKQCMAMASRGEISYLEKPLNPHIETYDPDLRSCSEAETRRWYQLEKAHMIKRSDWRSQRQRRDMNVPTDEDVQNRYGLCYETRRVPRNTSCRGPDHHAVIEAKVIADNIKAVITYKETIKSAELGTLPCIFCIHGGNRYGGTPYSGLFERAKEWTNLFQAIVVSVDYRLSPNQSDGSPTGEEPTNDCFDALTWIYQHLGADGDPVLKYGDRKKVILFGTSAGGGLAASTVLKWCHEQREGSCGTLGDLHGLLLEAPQLDDRCNTQSHEEFKKGNMFTSQDAIEGWKASLGARRGTENVSIFEAPARASAADVKGFPPSYIDVGTAEPFRDEAVDFYNMLRSADVEVEMKIWQGGFHGFFAAEPDALISRVCNLTKLKWLCRRLGVQNKGIDDEYEEVRAAYEIRSRGMV